MLLIILCLGAAGCVSIPDWYAPPMQRKALDIPDPVIERHFINMSDPIADAYIVSGVNPGAPGDVWRWTGPRPTLRFVLKKTKLLKFTMDLTINEETFRDTGPVTVTFLVNNQQLDKVRYDSPGDKRFEKEVPPEWLAADSETIVAAEIDPAWVSKLDGAKLGFILTRAGFVE